MSFAGHVFDMINRIKANRELLKKEKKFDFNSTFGNKKIYFDKEQLKKLSPKELEVYKTKLLKQKMQRGLKLSFLFISILLIMIFVIYYLLFVL